MKNEFQIIDHFEYNGKAVILKKPLLLEVSQVGDLYYAANNEIELYGNGKTEKEAVDNAREVFSGLFILSKRIIEMVDFEEVN